MAGMAGMAGGESMHGSALAEPGLIRPDWPLPANLRAVQTTRVGGVSEGPWASLNLALHTGDDPEAVAQNRARLAAALALPRLPDWPQQVHGVVVAEAGRITAGTAADAVVGFAPGAVCAVQTADCLPVLFASGDGAALAAAHAGWRGLVSGVLEATVRAMRQPPGEISAWLGPAIGPAAFEVGSEVRAAFLAADAGADAGFVPGRAGRWHADLYWLARRRLARVGVTAVHGGGHCTFTEAESFFSYRREGVCGRMATLIWRLD
jgi:polyphenol oxidase